MRRKNGRLHKLTRCRILGVKMGASRRKREGWHLCATHAHEKCNGCKDRISYMSCVFRVRALPISVFFWLRRKLCVRCVSCVAYDSLATACCRPVSSLCDTRLFTFLWRVSGSAVRHNVVMSNYVMSNFITLWRPPQSVNSVGAHNVTWVHCGQ